jgi:hypothetical protein
MADTNKKINFTMKVYDENLGYYVPVYVAPEATDNILGDVKLSDSTSSDSDVSNSVAATPKAVKTVQANVDTKLSMTDTGSQTVAGEVTFSGGIVGNLIGTAEYAEKLSNTVSFQTSDSVVLRDEKEKIVTSNIVASNLCDGSITIPLSKIYADNILWDKPTSSEENASTEPFVIPLASIPQGALERIVRYENLDEASSVYNSAAKGEKPFQTGDTIQLINKEDGTAGSMYVVISEPKDGEDITESSYTPYYAGTALSANTADRLSTDSAGSETQPVYFNEGIPKACSKRLDTSLSNIVIATEENFNSEKDKSNILIWIQP